MFDVHFSFPCGEGGSVRPASVFFLLLILIAIVLNFFLRIGFFLFLFVLFDPGWLLGALL